MSWWRKKADDEAGDDILELNDVVWRGVDQNDRLDRLAEAAKQTDGELPEPGERIYPPKKILPTVPLTAQLTPDQDADDDIATQKDAPEQFIETEIRNQIITEAMDAVLHFQKGQGQSPDDDDGYDQEELEAAIGEIADQTWAQAQDEIPDDHQASQLTTPPPTMPSPKSPDMSDAIRDVVADEIGMWLKDHMPRIIAETMAQASLEQASLEQASLKEVSHQAGQKKPAAKTKPAPKKVKKTAAKKAAKAKAKPKVQAKAAKKSAKKKKTKAN